MVRIGLVLNVFRFVQNIFKKLKILIFKTFCIKELRNIDSLL